MRAQLVLCSALIGPDIKNEKEVHMEGPYLCLPPPPFKSREQNRKDIFWALDPPPPLKTREINIYVISFYVFSKP